jgi:preprotein translocase subunit SecE
MEKFVEYLKETKGEMKHVSWPTKEQTIAFTALVIGISLVAAAILGLFDGIFKKALELFILK